MKLFTDWFIYFMIYSILGWICETIYCSIPERKFVYRGFLNGPYCPIYGCGAVLVILFLRRLSGQVVLLFVAGVVVTSALEYVTGWLMEKLFHHKWWDYSKHKYNLHGRICLINSVLFGVLCVILLKVLHPFCEFMIGLIPVLTKDILCAVLVMVFATDIITTVRSVINFNKTLVVLHSIKSELAERRGDVDDEIKRRRKLLRRRIHELQLKISPLQRRLLSAFPHMHSMRYHERLSEIKEKLRRRKLYGRRAGK